MKTQIIKITESFPNYNYDVETTKWTEVIYFWNNDGSKFFFEFTNIKKNSVAKCLYQDIVTTSKVKIWSKNIWTTISDNNIDELILKTKNVINDGKEIVA